MTYEQLREIGEAYERYVVERLTASGVRLARHDGRYGQVTHGDTTIGLEIKYDRQRSITGNAFIETAEKRRATDPDWRPSGIFSSSDARWYGVGDYRGFAIASRQDLRHVSVSARRRITIAAGTSQGFLMVWRDFCEISIRVYVWPDRLPDGTPDPPSTMTADDIDWIGRF